MATLTGNSIASTYKDLLQVSNSNAGVDATLRTVDDGEGTASALSISSAAIQVDNIKIDGNTITSEDTNGNITLTPNGTGDVEVSSGNLVIGTAGKGISFAATSDAGGMTSELLDDYEEGTWTPVLSDASEAGNVATGASLLGAYTKIGNMVTVTLRAINIDTSGMTAGNDLFIQGLPFNSNGSYNHIGSVATSDIAFSGHIAFYVSGGTNYSKLSDSITGTTTDYTTVADLTSGSADIQGIATYRT